MLTVLNCQEQDKRDITANASVAGDDEQNFRLPRHGVVCYQMCEQRDAR